MPDARSWINIKALRAAVCLYASSEGKGFLSQLRRAFRGGGRLTCAPIVSAGVCFSLRRFITPLFDFPALTLRVLHVKHSRDFRRGLFTQIMNQSIIYLRLSTGPVISAGHYHIQTRETCIIRRRLECVRELTACERRPDEPESSDTDFCLQEMGPCLLPLTQACTECNNTISLYYITLI